MLTTQFRVDAFIDMAFVAGVDMVLILCARFPFHGT